MWWHRPTFGRASPPLRKCGGTSRPPSVSSRWRPWVARTSSSRSGPWQSSPSNSSSGEGELSARRRLDQLLDRFFLGGVDPYDGVGGGPHVAVVEAGVTAEAEREVPLTVDLGAPEEADDLAVLGVGGLPVPQAGRQIGSGFPDESVEPRGDVPVSRRHLGDGGENSFFAFGLGVFLGGHCLPFTLGGSVKIGRGRKA